MKNNNKFPFKLGADPEFIIMNNCNYILHAQNTIQPMFSTKLTSEGLGFNTPCGNFGWDGMSKTGEFRPKPSKSPEEVADNLYELIKTLHNGNKLIDLKTFCPAIPIGGHIHFETLGSKSSNEWQKIDKTLISFFLPLMMGESRIQILKRKNNGYGSIVDYRLNGPTFEFRTPTAEWTTTREIAIGTLSYLGVVWNEIIKHPENIKKHKNLLFTTATQAEAVQNLALTDFEMFNKTLCNKIIKAIKTFELYPKFKEEIDFIANYEKILKIKKENNFSLINGWNLKEKDKKTKITKRQFSSQKYFLESAKKIDLDNIKSTIDINTNEDKFCDLFASDLQERLAAFQVMTKNKYILFGLRKNINHPFVFDTDKNIYEGKEIFTCYEIKDHLNKNIMEKMLSKWDNFISMQDANKNMEWKYLERKKSPSNCFFIGLPYETRIKKDFNVLRNIVFKLEKKNLSPIKINDIKVPNLEELTEENQLLTNIILNPANESNENITVQRISGNNPILN